MRATIDRISEWLEACDKLHGDVCVPKPIGQQPREDVPLWLIDLHQQCIVPGLSAHRYLALSYVWPESRSLFASDLPAPRTLLLDSANTAKFQCPGFLGDEEIAQRIPNVIKHAMKLTQALGERYLWVDRLCIVQNDLGNGGTQSQIAKMDKIYAGAYLTIIAAASENVYSGAKSLDKEWPSFQATYAAGAPNTPPRLLEESVIEEMSALHHALSKSKWATRGWTYQEQIMCKRAVIFINSGFFWDCHCCMWDGASLIPGQNFASVPLHADMANRLSTRWWPDFRFYVDLISPYNGRHFTYPQDAILGISGILNALGKSFPGGFICGLPRLFLDHALLWQPFGTADRRVDRVDDGTVRSSLPSWSWAGWQGFVDPWSLLSGSSYIYETGDQYRYPSHSWRTRSLVQWYISNDEQKLEPVLEPRILDKYANITHDTDSNDIPLGWTIGHSTFTHARDNSVRFKHPIPLKEEQGKHTLPANPAFLVCSTTTASFFPATVLKQKGELCRYKLAIPKISAFENKIFKRRPTGPKASPVVVLQQPNGAFAGLLRLMSNDNIDKHTPFELIAISTGTVSGRDLRRSIEWQLFELGQDFYRFKDSSETYYYRPEWVSEKGKYALLFDLVMAFNKEVVNDEYVRCAINEKLTKVDKRNEEKVQKAAAEESETFSTEFLHLEKWFEARTEFLEERVRNSRWRDQGQEDICEFYNVLWIERIGGVAYRRACGWVPKHIWEAYATGPVDVKLG